MTAAAALREALAEAGVRSRARRGPALAPGGEIGVRAGQWGTALAAARGAGFRLASLWAESRPTSLLVTALLERGGSYVAARTRARGVSPEVPSITPVYPAADRLERHARDLLGLVPTGHPDQRRWTRHRAWGESEHPLGAAFPSARAPDGPTPPDVDYPFVATHGSGAYEIPVGPVHAGVIEPGHFRFQAVGEEILRLEARLGYVHKGIEKIAEGRDPAGLARLAARVSGDSALAHAWAACMAVERAAGCTPPARALALRAAACEIERVVNHLWDLAAILNDVTFPFGYYQLGRLVEDWRRASARAFGNRLLMDALVPGGMAGDLAANEARHLLERCRATGHELAEVWAIVQANASVHDRLAGTGILEAADARDLGAVGFVGRASGQDFDVRRDAPYPPYDTLEVAAPCYPHGDVAARARVRHDEILISLGLLERLLAALPDGPIAATLHHPPPGAEGLGIVDGWRGEIATYVRFGPGGRIARFFPRDPSWLTWPALERLVHGNIVPDFPVCNKYVNGSYAGHDL